MTRAPIPYLPLAGFAAAFGLVEAAVVVDLRRLVDPAGTLFPRVELPPELLPMEMLREASTLIVLWIVAHLAGRDRTSRFAAFLFVFGLWDLAYYAALRAAIDWPRSLAAWDLLFLLPRPWYGPVYAPVAVALVMAACGAVALHQIAERGAFPVRARHVVGAAAGGGIVAASFLASSPAGLLPERYRVELGAIGLAIGIVSFVDAFRSGARGIPRLPLPSVSPRPPREPPPEGASSSAGEPTSTDRAWRAPPSRGAR